MTASIHWLTRWTAAAVPWDTLSDRRLVPRSQIDPGDSCTSPLCTPTPRLSSRSIDSPRASKFKVTLVIIASGLTEPHMLRLVGVVSQQWSSGARFKPTIAVLPNRRKIYLSARLRIRQYTSEPRCKLFECSWAARPLNSRVRCYSNERASRHVDKINKYWSCNFLSTFGTGRAISSEEIYQLSTRRDTRQQVTH